MSNTFKHKDKGKYHNKVLKYNDVCDSTKNMWDRHNSDISEDKQELFKIKNKIAKKELKIELKNMEQYKTIHQNKQDLNQFFSESIVEKMKPLQLLNNLKQELFTLDRFTPLNNSEMLEDIDGEYVLISSVLNLFSANKNKITEFKSINKFNIIGKGTVFLVTLQSEENLIGKTVLIDNENYEVRGVEQHAVQGHYGVYKIGQEVGLLVRKIEE